MLEVPSLRGKRIGEAALEALGHHPFLGNVRELKHVIERAVYRDTSEELTPEDLGLAESPSAPPLGEGTFKARIESLERELIEEALAEAGGNQAEAARRLGLSYHQFRYYLRKHGAE
jgi:DNA-binding NtrC family response regulator